MFNNTSYLRTLAVQPGWLLQVEGDPDADLVPHLVETVVVPKLAGILENVYNAASMQEVRSEAHVFLGSDKEVSLCSGCFFSDTELSILAGQTHRAVDMVHHVVEDYQLAGDAGPITVRVLDKGSQTSLGS